MAVNIGSAQIFSTPGTILVEINNERSKDKDFQQAKKKLLKNYNLKKLGKLQQKYIKSPAKLRLEIEAYFKEFERDFLIFTQFYEELYKHILAVFEAAESEEYSDLLGFRQLVTLVEARAKEHPKEFYFPKTGQKAFHKEFKKVLKMLAGQLAGEYSMLQRLSKGKKQVAGFFSRFIKERSAERRSARAAKRLTDRVNALTEVVKHLQYELQTGVQQDFLALLLQYVTEMHRLVGAEGDIKEDMIIVIQDVEKEVTKVLGVLYPFLAVNERDPTIAAMVQKIQETFGTTHQNILAKLREEEQWEVYIESICKSMSDSEQKLLAQIQGFDEKATPEQVERWMLGR